MNTQMCASAPTTMTERAPTSIRPCATSVGASAENTVLAYTGGRGLIDPSRCASEGTVGPSPEGYCSVTKTGMAMRCAVSSSSSMARSIRAASGA